MKIITVKICKQIAVMIAVFVFLISFSVQAFAKEDAQKVKVGFFAFDGYHMQDRDGIRSGYGYEILQHIAGYAGLRYEYVGYGKSWSQMQDMLEQGEIDLLTSAQKTPERERRFDFSNKNIGHSAAILTVKAGDTRFMDNNYTRWQGIHVGMIKGNSRNKSFAKFAKEHAFGYVPVYFNKVEDMVAALKGNEHSKPIDAILSSNLRQIEGEWILAQFDTSPFYIMVKKGNTGLLSRINFALDSLYQLEPGIRTRLMNKYYNPTNDDEIAFSLEERDFIQKMQGHTFTALINPDRMPYSFFQNGKLTGLSYDLAELIIKRSKLNIKFLDVHDRQEYRKKVKDGAADIRFDVIYSTNRAEKDGYWLTKGYINIPLFMLHRNNITSIKKIAVPFNKDVTYYFDRKAEVRGYEITNYDSIEKVIASVKKGEQEGAILARDTAIQAVRDDITNQLALDDLYLDDLSFSIAVNSSQSSLLFSILNKVVAGISPELINSYRQRYNITQEKPFSLIGFFYNNPAFVFLSAVLLLVLVFLIIVVYFLNKRSKNEHEHLEKERQLNDSLKDALTEAEKAGAAKSQFLSRVSHEMRTPLNAIIGFIELSKGADLQKTQGYLVSSDLAAKQLLSVINDVLDMSSIESGKMQIASVPFNFKHIVSSLTNIYGAQCKQKGIKFEARLRGLTEEWFIGDELRVNQIMMNLLGNAVKFTARGHITLTISQLNVRDETVYLRFEVADSGCGMSNEMHERLFKPFEQESAITARKYGGSGLGLSIVKNLVQMMNGSVSVTSEPNKGSVFTVDLSFMKAKIEQNTLYLEKSGELRVLAVDDEQSEREYTCLVLERMGVGFSCVNNGQEAIAELEKGDKEGRPYNVCLIDWRMPELNGFETTKMIRRKYGKDVVVIIVSAYDFHQAGESVKEAGADLYISKPLFQSSLFDLFMSLTGGKIAQTEVEPHKWDFTGKRVLLAEDNRMNQVVIEGYFEKLNLACDIANNGQEAVEKFEASPHNYYDAVLMDIQMPIMNGFEAAKIIRASLHPDANNIPIIAQTADAFNEDIARALSVGMNAHVAKPIKFDTLVKTLNKAFGMKKEGVNND